MNKKPKISDADKALFEAAMRHVKPLAPSKKITPEPERPKPRVRKPAIDSETSLSALSDFETLDPLSSDDLVEFARPGLQNKILRDLRTGKYNIEAILDLHGMTVVEAREALHQFFLQCTKRRLRHVLIIHGKGRGDQKPILKNKINHWLRQLSEVLAFCSATGREGRSGAMVVYLKQVKGATFP